METLPAFTLVLADEHGIVREGIAAFCKQRSEITILGQCSDGEQAVEMILTTRADFAVFDLDMPKLGGLEIVKAVRSASCPSKLIVLSANRDERLILDLFRAGVDGYVLKDGPATHLFDAFGCVAEGRRYLTPLLRFDSFDREKGEPSEKRAVPDPVSLLSKREYEVFSYLVEGIRPKDIAKMLEISPKTVDTYRANIMRKLELDGLAGLVRFALQRNMTTTTSSAT